MIQTVKLTLENASPSNASRPVVSTKFMTIIGGPYASSRSLKCCLKAGRDSSIDLSITGRGLYLKPP